MAFPFLLRYLACLWISVLLVEANLPYNPAQAFRSTRDDDPLAYVFLQSPSSSRFQLLTLNISATLDVSNIPYKIVSLSLPFLEDDDRAAFTPFMDDGGNISVYAGTCAPQGTTGKLWRLAKEELHGEERSWDETTVETDRSETGNLWQGANFLASGISFSTEVDAASETKKYVFGGMCPFPMSVQSDEAWISSANYSNTMLSLIPAPSLDASPSLLPSSSSNLNYTLLATASRDSPVAEAGYSITALQPSFFNNSGKITGKHQNFVLIGGHTKSAFVNMSQAALFSLPEEGWTFLPIETPSLLRTESGLMTPQSPTSIDSRSGHTAALTSDGKRIVVLGGWVGDINTLAQPQLLYLELGKEYGGTGSWKWTVPKPSGNGLQDGSGIYGHGAMMLPGDVLMVMGGYSIPKFENGRVKRSSQTRSENTYFLNVTTNTWISTYTNPVMYSHVRGDTEAQKPSGLSSSSKKAALGSGLALGIAAIIGAILVGLWYSRRLRKRRIAREKELRNLSFTAQRFNSISPESDTLDMARAEKSSPDWMRTRSQFQGNPAYPWTTNGGNSVGDGLAQREHQGTEAERTGLLVEIPSPTRGLRRSLHSRGRKGERLSYQLAPTKEDARRSFVGSIHPIDERDEFEEPAITAAESEIFEHTLVALGPTLDPFRDPDPLGSHPVSQETSPISPARERELEIQEWVSDWEAADAHLYGSSTGRGSPDRSSPDKDRTSSNLSENTVHSATGSIPSQYHSGGTISRSVSQRSGGLFGGGYPRSPSKSPAFDQAAGGSNVGGGGRTSPQHQRRTQSFRLHRRSSSSGSPSFMPPPTADFTQLQAEGEALLPRPDFGNQPESPTKKSRTSNWIGSVRRALPFVGGSTAPSEDCTYHLEEHRPPSSPSRVSPIDNHPPRRAASASAYSYWRRKQGAADWDVQVESSHSNRGNQDHHRHRHLEEEIDDPEEWDVEAAIERRVVQVMFTVPKEKLRVVNAIAGETDSLEGEEKGVGASKQEEKKEEEDDSGKEKGKGKGKGKAKAVVDEEKEEATPKEKKGG